MREEVANLVYPVLLHGIGLKAKLERGQRATLASEQATLKGLLGSGSHPPPFGPERESNASMGRGKFLGIRYALTCWLDEILIDSPWKREWDENKLESALFQTNIRYRNFWEQARLAEAMPGTPDAHEAFLLCVVLGFRGEMGEEPDRLREWVSAARARVMKASGREPPAIPEKAPESNVPLLLGINSYRRMSKALVFGFLVAVPVIAFSLVSLLR